MASLSPFSRSVFARASLADVGHHRVVRRPFTTQRVLALTQLVGLAGAAAFISLFGAFAAASETAPLAQALIVGLFLIPLSVLGYFGREAVAQLRPLALERRRSAERPVRLVIDA